MKPWNQIDLTSVVDCGFLICGWINQTSVYFISGNEINFSLLMKPAIKPANQTTTTSKTKINVINRLVELVWLVVFRMSSRAKTELIPTNHSTNHWDRYPACLVDGCWLNQSQKFSKFNLLKLMAPLIEINLITDFRLINSSSPSSKPVTTHLLLRNPACNPTGANSIQFINPHSARSQNEIADVSNWIQTEWLNCWIIEFEWISQLGLQPGQPLINSHFNPA